MRKKHIFKSKTNNIAKENIVKKSKQNKFEVQNIQKISKKDDKNKTSKSKKSSFIWLFCVSIIAVGLLLFCQFYF